MVVQSLSFPLPDTASTPPHNYIPPIKDTVIHEKMVEKNRRFGFRIDRITAGKIMADFVFRFTYF